MAQQMRVEHGAAHQALNVADDHLNDAYLSTQSALDTATQICSGPWLGAASQKYLQGVQAVHDEIIAEINKGRHYVETARNNLNLQANQDAEV